MLTNTSKKLFAVVVTLFMLICMMSPAIGANETFTDMPTNWSKAAVQYAIDNGLLVGSNGKVAPNDYVTRAQMAAITVRAFGSTEKADITKFIDVPSDIWYANDIAKAVKMGIFVGSGTKMQPNDKITREQAFAVLARAFKLAAGTGEGLIRFTDKAQISDLYVGELAALVEAGYVVGSNNTLNPKGLITRAELAQVMYGIIKSFINTAGTYTAVQPGTVMINVPGVTLKNLTVSGDLIIGDGVGTGDVTLDNIKVTGRTVIRGGGKNSVHVINGSTLTGTVIIDNVNNEVRIVTDKGTVIEKIEAGSEIILEGQFGEVLVVGEKETSIEIRGKVETLVVEAPFAEINVAATGSVATVKVEESATGTAITGSGTVTSVQVQANDVQIGTGNTKVTVGDNVTGTTVGDTEIEEGETVVTNPGGNNVTQPSTPGGGSTPPPAFAVSSLTFVSDVASNNVSIASPYVLDLSGAEYANQEANKDITFNGFRVNANETVDKIEVVGYSDRFAEPDAQGLFTLSTVTGIDVGFDGDVTVYTLKNLIGGSISKTLKIYSADGDVVQITVTLTTIHNDVAVEIPEEFVGLYSISINTNLPTEKEVTVTLRPSADGSQLVADFATFFNDVIELASIPAGYTFNGLYIIDEGVEHGPYSSNYGVNLNTALGNPGIANITLSYLAANDISIKVTATKDATPYTAQINF